MLGSTFTFPQSLGILGGRPGASTYIVGVQDDKAFYLDPHEVHPVQCDPTRLLLHVLITSIAIATVNQLYVHICYPHITS